MARPRRLSTNEREFLSQPTDLDRLQRMADGWRLMADRDELSEIDRAIAEIERLRSAQPRPEDQEGGGR